MTTLVLTAIGDDRPGLVDALADSIAEHGGSWEQSHMARLAGQFAGIVVVTVPDRQASDLIAGLEGLGTRGILDVHVRGAGADGQSDDAAGPVLSSIHLVGQDRPGIVREIARALASRDVSITELASEISSAPMSGERLFEADLTVQVPNGTDPEDLQSALEDIANELMVDLEFAEA